MSDDSDSDETSALKAVLRGDGGGPAGDDGDEQLDADNAALAAVLGAAASSSSASKPPQEFFDAALAANAQMQEFCRTQLGAIGRALAAHARPSAAPHPPRVQPAAWPCAEDPTRSYFYDEAHPEEEPHPLHFDAVRRAALDREVPLRPEKGKEARPWKLQERRDLKKNVGALLFNAANTKLLEMQQQERQNVPRDPEYARDIKEEREVLARVATEFGNGGYKLGDGDAEGVEIRETLSRLLDEAGDYESGTSNVPWSMVAEMMPGGARSAVECSVQWRQVDDPRIRPFLHKMGLQKQEPRVDVPFGDAEAAELRSLVEEGGLTHGRWEGGAAWQQVALGLAQAGYKGRTPMGCIRAYKYLARRDAGDDGSGDDDESDDDGDDGGDGGVTPALALSLRDGDDGEAPPVYPLVQAKKDKKKKRRSPAAAAAGGAGGGGSKFTKEEDAALKAAVEAYGTEDWSLIASRLDGRNGQDCRLRWTYSQNPTIKRGAWTPAEDAKLREGVSQYGEQDWSKWVPLLLAGPDGRRTDAQARDRWFNQLQPGLKRCETWTAEEDALLRAAVAEQGDVGPGFPWAKVATKVPGRTDRTCTSRWKALKKADAAGLSISGTDLKHARAEADAHRKMALLTGPSDNSMMVLDPGRGCGKRPAAAAAAASPAPAAAAVDRSKRARAPVSYAGQDELAPGEDVEVDAEVDDDGDAAAAAAAPIAYAYAAPPRTTGAGAAPAPARGGNAVAQKAAAAAAARAAASQAAKDAAAAKAAHFAAMRDAVGMGPPSAGAAAAPQRLAVMPGPSVAAVPAGAVRSVARVSNPIAVPVVAARAAPSATPAAAPNVCVICRAQFADGRCRRPGKQGHAQQINIVGR